MDKKDYGVHASHCCVKHGCKYGDKDCPVVNKEIKQEYLCESCDEDGIKTLDELYNGPVKEFNGESCTWCKNVNHCDYKRNRMELTREAVKSILFITPAYCSGRVTCDYYIQDKDVYYKYHKGDTK